MSDIEFEADVQNNPHYATKTPGVVKSSTSSSGSDIGMVRWLVRHGIISSDSVAKTFLIGFIIVNFIITGFIMYFYVLRG